MTAALLLLALAAPPGDWTDRGEYDLALAVRAEASPKKRIQILDQWKAKYPASGLSQIRRELYLSAYQSLGDNDAMLGVAKEMISAEPDNLTGRYWAVVLIPGNRDTSPETLVAGEKAARSLLSGATVPADQTAPVTLLAHRALGWILWQRGEIAPAQEEFTACLKQQPDDAEVSAWFGTVLALQKEDDKKVAALWHLARAASLRGDRALPLHLQRQIGGLFEKLYVSYHGDDSGLDDLRKQASAAPFPPADFKIESAAAIAARKQQEELERTNPQLAAWMKIRKQLEAPDGAQFFDNLKAEPLPKLKGTVIRSSPPARPNEIVLGLSEPAVEEIVLRLSSALPVKVDPGTELQFEGRAESFMASPFSLVVVAEREKVEGWSPSSQRRKD